MTRKRIGVLALQGAFREHRRMFEGLGADTRLVRWPAELDGLDGLVIPGGESTAIAKLLAIHGLYEPLRAAHAAVAEEAVAGKHAAPAAAGAEAPRGAHAKADSKTE